MTPRPPAPQGPGPNPCCRSFPQDFAGKNMEKYGKMGIGTAIQVVGFHIFFTPVIYWTKSRTVIWWLHHHTIQFRGSRICHGSLIGDQGAHGTRNDESYESSSHVNFLSTSITIEGVSKNAISWWYNPQLVIFTNFTRPSMINQNWFNLHIWLIAEAFPSCSKQKTAIWHLGISWLLQAIHHPPSSPSSTSGCEEDVGDTGELVHDDVAAGYTLLHQGRPWCRPSRRMEGPPRNPYKEYLG